MRDQNQVYPLTPARARDEENATPKPSTVRERRNSKCLVYLLVVIVFLSVIGLALAILLRQIRTPDIKLTSVAVENLRYGAAPPPPSFNGTLVAKVAVENRNFGDFEFENGGGGVLYEGVMIGEIKIVKGSAKAREMTEMNVSVKVRSNRSMDNQKLSSDINSGMLKLSSHAKLNGGVRLIKIITKRKTAEMNCTMTLNLRSQAIQDLLCG